MNKNISKKDLREFGFLMTFFIPFLIGWLIPFITGHSFRIWTLWIAIPFFLFGVLRPSILFFPYKIWLRIGNFLGGINSFIILWLIFMLVLIPIAFIMRLFNYDPLKRKKIIVETYRELKTNDEEIDLTRIF